MKRYYRFFSGFNSIHEKWLNKMAADGMRLVHTDKASYDFEESSEKYVYAVEFIGNKSKIDAEDYAEFLRECGYKVFFKNINLNYSFVKVRYRPWADKGAKIATSATTYNRELLIIEKPDDGRPFELHSTTEDKLKYAKTIRKPYLFFALICIIMAFVIPHIVWWIFGVASLIPVILYQCEIIELKKQSHISE